MGCGISFQSQRDSTSCLGHRDRLMKLVQEIYGPPRVAVENVVGRCDGLDGQFLGTRDDAERDAERLKEVILRDAQQFQLVARRFGFG